MSFTDPSGFIANAHNPGGDAATNPIDETHVTGWYTPVPYLRSFEWRGGGQVGDVGVAIGSNIGAGGQRVAETRFKFQRPTQDAQSLARRFWNFAQDHASRSLILRSLYDPAGLIEDSYAAEYPVGVAIGIVGGLGLGGKISAARGAGIVASNGTRITGLTRHGVNRAAGDGAARAGTRPQAILDALRNPKRIVEGVDRQGRPFQVFHGTDARVVVNPQTGKIVSTNPLSGAGAL